MKILRHFVCGLVLLLLTSCNFASSKSGDASPLVLTLEIVQKEIHSFDEIQFQVVLTNQGATSLLVHSRLYHFGVPVDAKFAEMLILISDSNGNEVANYHVYPNYELPSLDTLVELKPGDQVVKTFYLSGGGFFYEGMFKKGEKYTIVAIYQNGLDASKTIDGAKVPAWVGSVRSNEESFVILP